MLTNLKIESFLLIAYADIDLTGAAIHAFYGGNEAGKSSIAQAVRFAFRGMNERVLKKADYDLLITNGKRSGAVEAMVNDAPMRRTVRDGKLTTRNSMEFDEDHIDIQLGAVEFARQPPDKLRPLLLDLFEAKPDAEFVRERLLARDLDEGIIKLALPLIKSVGFASAATKAATHATEARGQWKGITNEAYGHVKAESWEPSWLATTPMPASEEIEKWHTEVKRLADEKSALTSALAAAAETLKLRGALSDGTTIEDAEAALQIAQDELRDCEDRITDADSRYRESIAGDEVALRNAERNLTEAKNAAAQLKCPCCDAVLKVVMRENTPVLERESAENSRASRDVSAAAQAVASCKLVLQTRNNGRDSAIAELKRARALAQEAVNENRATLENAKKLSLMPNITQAQLDDLQSELMLIEEPLQKAQDKLEKLQAAQRQIIGARIDIERATNAHKLAQQWAVVEELCGPTSAGLPAELIGRVTTPLNEALREIADLWGVDAARVDADMRVFRADGMPYALLSGSAQWRMNVMMQLALAQLTKLKLVVIDQFDVLQSSARGDFFGMLSDYTAQHPEVCVLAFGTLKATPPPFDGIRFHHVDGGAVKSLAA